MVGSDNTFRGTVSMFGGSWLGDVVSPTLGSYTLLFFIQYYTTPKKPKPQGG